MAARSETGRRLKELEELRALVARLEEENAHLWRMHATRLAAENERLARSPDAWTAMSPQEESRYVSALSQFRAGAKSPAIGQGARS